MQVVFIGKNHPFSLVPLEAIRKAHSITGIIESGPRSSANLEPRSWLDSLRFRSRVGTLPRIAADLKIPYIYLSRESKSGLAPFLKSLEVDILCVASLSQLLNREVLMIPKHGAINLHPSLLPKYHGPFPWFWQYHDFEKEWGVTVHALDEGQDTGPIIKQEAFELQTGTDIIEAIKIVAPVGARLMVEALDEIATGTATFREQPSRSYPKARIVRRNEHFIDWKTWNIERVWHFMRGTYLWVDAVDYPVKGPGVTWRIGEIERVDCEQLPGEVHRDSAGYYVAHREGKIRLGLVRSRIQSLKHRVRARFTT